MLFGTITIGLDHPRVGGKYFDGETVYEAVTGSFLRKREAHDAKCCDDCRFRIISA